MVTGLIARGRKTHRCCEHSTTILYRTRIAKPLRFGCLNRFRKGKKRGEKPHVIMQDSICVMTAVVTRRSEQVPDNRLRRTCSSVALMLCGSKHSDDARDFLARQRAKCGTNIWMILKYSLRSFNKKSLFLCDFNIFFLNLIKMLMNEVNQQMCFAHL